MRNIGGFLFTVGGALYLGDYLFCKFGAERLGEWLRFLFAIYMPLVPLVFQMIHKLSSLRELDGLDARERERLSGLVSGKVSRLWWLIALCLLSAIVGWAAYLTATDPELDYPMVLFAIALSVSSIYWSLFVPFTFGEIVQFRTTIKDRLEQRNKREETLKEMRIESEEEFDSDEHLSRYNEVIKWN